MKKLSRMQFLSLLLINDAFVMFCLMDSVTVITIAGFLTATAVQGLIALPLVKLYKNSAGIESADKINYLIFFVYLVLWGGMLFSMQWNTSKVIYIPYENSGIVGKLVISGLIALVCLYITSAGLKSLSRSGVISACVGAVCLVVVLVNALFYSDWENLTRLENSRNYFYELERGFAISGGLGTFAVLSDFTKGDPVKNSLLYFTGKAVLILVTLLPTVLVAGGIMSITDFPVVTALQLSQPFPVQRIDSLFLIIFSVLCVFSIALQAVTAVYLLQRTVPELKYKSCIVLLLMIGAGFLFQGRTHYGIVYAVTAAAVLLTIPVFRYVKNIYKRV